MDALHKVTRGLLLAARCGAMLVLTAPHLSAQNVIPSGPVLNGPAVATAPTPLNLHVVLSEDFLNSVAARKNTQSGEVRDVFQDVPIEGQQTTTTWFCVDLLPSQTEGRVVMVLEGETSNTTSGFSPQAIVNSVGHVQFRATKDILFDGYQLATRHAQVAVLRLDNQSVGAVTQLTGSPLGPLAEHVVLEVAKRKKPASDQFARQRVVEKVGPKMDAEVDAMLSKANVALKEILQARLKAARLMPERVQVRSSATHLHFATSMAVPLDVAAIGPAPDELVENHGASFYLHESLMQGIIERSGLAGRTVTHEEQKRLLELVGLSAKDLPLGEMEVAIEFTEVDPLVIDVGEEETRVTLRAAFRPSGQPALGPLAITVPYRMKERGDQWILQTGPVEVRTLEEGSDGRSITELAVKNVIEAALPKVSFPKQLPASVWPEGKTPPSITSVRSGNGWLVIGMDHAPLPSRTMSRSLRK